MSLDGDRFDVIVIGGGFAGVTAARDLTEQGNTVLLLEAHQYLGGRTRSTTFPCTEVHIEGGGQFVCSPRRHPPKWLMTIEGAVESGHRPAWQTENHLQREREAASIASI